jgi:hypothetical protein
LAHVADAALRLGGARCLHTHPRRIDMHAAEQDITIELEVGDIVTRGEEWGDQIVRHLRLPAGTDFRPLLAGLPDDRCACPHWGYILEGSITLRYADGTEETNRAGDTYYWPGGHTGWSDEGVTFIEFSPADERVQHSRLSRSRAAYWLCCHSSNRTTCRQSSTVRAVSLG